MPRKDTKKLLLPIKSLLLFLLGAAAIIQAVLMSYLHLTGIYVINDAVAFWATIILGSLISALAGFVLTVPDLLVISWLNRHFKWSKKAVLRICIQFVLTIIVAEVISVLLTLMSELIIGYKDPLNNVIIRNALIFPIVNILLMSILEGWLFFRESKKNKEKVDILSHELLESKYKVLKNQIEPHFMFNNLNAISALIDSNPPKAQQFVDVFSDLYRYILDMIEKPVVAVVRELEFIKSYIYLHKIRHNDAIVLNCHIPKEIYDANIPPLSLQTAIENAIKHNAFDIQNPLVIELSYSSGYIEVKNKIQAPISSKPSNGLGEYNLAKRYEIISDTLPVFEKRDGFYIVQLPIIRENEV